MQLHSLLTVNKLGLEMGMCVLLCPIASLNWAGDWGGVGIGLVMGIVNTQWGPLNIGIMHCLSLMLELTGYVNSITWSVDFKGLYVLFVLNVYVNMVYHLICLCSLITYPISPLVRGREVGFMSCSVCVKIVLHVCPTVQLPKTWMPSYLKCHQYA